MGGNVVSERDQHAILIQKHVRGWLLRLKLKKDLEILLKETQNEYLLYTPQQYIFFKSVQVIERVYLKYKAKRDYKRKRYNAATKIASCYRR